WNAIDWNRDLLLPAADIRKRERDLNMTDKGRCNNTVSLHELRRGEVGVVIGTLLGRLVGAGDIPAVGRVTSMEAAYAAAVGQLAYYRALTQQGVLRWIKDAPTLETHIRAWEKDDSGKQPLGFILSMEGADPVLSPDQVEEWWHAGLRIIGPAHYG